MNKSFKGEYISFFMRLIKRLFPLILTVVFVFIKIYYGRLFSGNLAEYRIHASIILVIGFIYGVYYQMNRLRTVINEIIFSENNFQVIGEDFSSRFEDNLDLNKLIIEIQEEELGKNKVRYCLEIYYDDKYYYLNKFNDWKYSTLAEIVDEYQLRTGKTVHGNLYYSELVKDRQLNAA